MQVPNIVETDLTFNGCLNTRNETNRIVVHHVGGANRDFSAEEIHGWHLNQGWAGIGYHFVIRTDGSIERGRPEDKVGAHAKGFNHDSIGINVAGTFDEAEPTNEQIEAVSMLIGWLADKYNVPISADSVCGHRDLMETDCPGEKLYDMLDVVRGKAEFYRVE